MTSLGVVLVAGWLTLVGVGARAIYAYSTTPGEQAPAPSRWPTDSTLDRPSNRLVIVMFVHAECPCTRASLHELGELARGAEHRASIRVVFDQAGDAWELAGTIAGATRVLDPLGREASRFGAKTSGHVVVYDAGGTQRYAGGITGSRGHVGDNMGRRIIEGLLAGSSHGELGYPVFGCAL